MRVNKLPLPDSNIIVYSGFYSENESMDLFNLLKENTIWEQKSIKVYGKKQSLPRLTAWYGDSDLEYVYSGIKQVTKPWTNVLLEIKEKIQLLTNTSYNSCLLNLYRNQFDSISYHSDDEKELGDNPCIASLSLGATRLFQLKHKNNKYHQNIMLFSGDMIIMKDQTQKYWLHQIPKNNSPCDARINLTFRSIYSPTHASLSTKK